jgi:hypothetical protein
MVMSGSDWSATVQEAGAVMFARPDRTARMSLEHGLSEPLSLSERPLTGLRKKVAQKIGPQAMAQCGSGNALPVFEFRKNVVSDGFQGGSRGVQESMPNRMPERVSPFDLADHACRPDCGACCIAPSISSPIPGMPHGKPAGVRSVTICVARSSVSRSGRRAAQACNRRRTCAA